MLDVQGIVPRWCASAISSPLVQGTGWRGCSPGSLLPLQVQ